MRVIPLAEKILIFLMLGAVIFGISTIIDEYNGYPRMGSVIIHFFVASLFGAIFWVFPYYAMMIIFKIRTLYGCILLAFVFTFVLSAVYTWTAEAVDDNATNTIAAWLVCSLFCGILGYRCLTKRSVD